MFEAKLYTKNYIKIPTAITVSNVTFFIYWSQLPFGFLNIHTQPFLAIKPIFLIPSMHVPAYTQQIYLYMI